MLKNIFLGTTRVLTVLLWLLCIYLLLAKAPYLGKLDRIPLPAHLSMFFALAFMTICSQYRPKIILTLIFIWLFGAGTEMIQYFNPPRTAEFSDFKEDVIGSILGLVAALIFMKILRLTYHTIHSKKTTSESLESRMM